MRQRAFSLVELVVVIGIIAVLMGLLMPALRRARDAAQIINCALRLRQVALGIHLYANDNQGEVPCTWIDYTKPDGSPDAWACTEEMRGSPYIHSGTYTSGIGRLFTCKYITDLRTYWCPMRDIQPNVTKPGQYAFKDNIQVVTFYVYRYSLGNKATSIYKTALPFSVEKFPGKLSFLGSHSPTAVWCANPYLTNTGQIAHQRGFNFAGYDGSVHFMPKEKYKYFPYNYSGGTLPDVSIAVAEMDKAMR